MATRAPATTGGNSREHERSGEAPESSREDGSGGHADSSNTVDHKFVGKE
ncbi:hypothetical protein [Streptomyces sp. NPDC055140]